MGRRKNRAFYSSVSSYIIGDKGHQNMDSPEGRLFNKELAVRRRDGCKSKKRGSGVFYNIKIFNKLFIEHIQNSRIKYIILSKKLKQIYKSFPIQRRSSALNRRNSFPNNYMARDIKGFDMSENFLKDSLYKNLLYKSLP